MKREIKKIKQLFAFLDDSAVRYCHWKSNQHLEEALSGKTDLDILVDSTQAGLCRQLFQDFGCKQVVPQPRSQYPGIEDWLAFDEETGRLAHIHLHFSLIVGAQPKNYHLPVENWLLSDCDSLYDLKIAAHEKELIMLIVRIAFKTKYSDLLKASLIPSYEFMPRTIRAELDWLLERVDVKNITGHLITSGLPVDVSLLVDCLDRYATRRLTPAYFLGLKIKLIGCLKNFKRRSFLSVQTLRAKFFFESFFLHAQSRKTLSGRGIFFALVGADGSGKTRLARDLLSWLSWKLETRVLYFGIPKATLAYRCLAAAIHVTDRLQKKAYHLRCNVPGSLLGAFSRGSTSLLWVYIGCHRYVLSRQAKTGQKRGCVLIGERFPLEHFTSMTEPMDGPRLQKQAKSSVFSGLELFFYKRIEMPDRLFVLKAGVDVLHTRKNITPMLSLRDKADAVNMIKANETTTIVDAEASYESVLRTIKIDVWNLL